MDRFFVQKQNINSLIIDLRDNGGGIVQEALTIADYMLEKDAKMLITVNKKENEETTSSSSQK